MTGTRTDTIPAAATTVRQEVLGRLLTLGPEGTRKQLFEGISISDQTRDDLIASLATGHHLYLSGPPGSGKSLLAGRIATLLPDRTVIAGCPVNCPFPSADCPWCRERLSRGEVLTATTLSGPARARRVSGSAELKAADLVGDLDPLRALEYGILDPRAFIPGKLLRANGGLLLVDFMDRMPERVLNTVLAGLAGDGVSIGSREEPLALDVWIVATGSQEGMARLPLDLADLFDCIRLEYTFRPEFLCGRLSPPSSAPAWVGPAGVIIARTRQHEDLARGVSTRGVIRYGELLASFSRLAGEDSPGTVVPPASQIALPHRVQTAAHAAPNRSAREIITEITEEVLGLRRPPDDQLSLSREAMLAVVDEIARVDHIRKPLKFGLFDLLLARLKRFPESELAQLHRRMAEHLFLRWRDREMEDNLTLELLDDIESVRKNQERLTAELRARLELEALIRTVEVLEEHGILSHRERGYGLSRRGIALLMDQLAPRIWEGGQLVAGGRHGLGKKQPVGEGRIVGNRPWRFGDSYRDFSLKDTIRQAVRRHHLKVAREDIRVFHRDIRSRLDILLCLDLSGTMEQLEKLWYAKEAAIALALSASRYGDRLGVVTFSNLATVVSDLTTNTFRITEKVLDLDLHPNAFTNLGYGILTARTLFARHSRSHAKQHILLVSDGDATAPHPSPARFALQEAARATRKGITISCVCLNEKNADPELLHRISRIGRGRTTVIEDTRNLKEAMVQSRNAAAL